MVDFRQGKIYKLTCADPDYVYYGSTVLNLNHRLAIHAVHYNNIVRGVAGIGRITSMILYEKGGVEIVLVENFPCNSAMELAQREGWYIANNPCVNKRKAGVNVAANYAEYFKNYRAENRQKINNNQRIYYQNNKENINAKRSEKVPCNKCGKNITKSNMLTHLKNQRIHAIKRIL